MGKRQAKKTAGWSKLVVGVTVSVVTYLLGIFLISLLMVKEIIIPKKSGLVLAAWAMVSACCGSLPVLKMKTVSPLLACLIQGGGFVILMPVASYLFWEGPVWSNTNVALLLCALAGGLMPGLIRNRGGRRKRKHGW